jgi:hypothetical protein
MAANTDKLMEVGNPGTATTLAAPGYTTGGTSITVVSTTNWPTATGVCFAMDEAEIVDGVEVQVAGSYNEYFGTVASGTSVTNVTHVTGSGTDRNYSAGALSRVYVPVSAGRENRIVEWGTEEHKQTGAHSDITADTINNAGVLTQTGVASFTTHIDVNDSSTAIRDSSDNELVKFSKTASAVNELTIANAATANGPELQATGGDTNIDVEVITKGTGKLRVNGNPFDDGAWATWSPTLTNLSGGTQNEAVYCQIGKTVHFRFRYTLAGAGVSGAVSFTLPVTPNTNYGANDRTMHASIDLLDSGVGLYPGFLKTTSTNGTVSVRAQNASGTYLSSTDLSSTIPFTWGNGDVIIVCGTYEAA